MFVALLSTGATGLGAQRIECLCKSTFPGMSVATIRHKFAQSRSSRMQAAIILRLPPASKPTHSVHTLAHSVASKVTIRSFGIRRKMGVTAATLVIVKN
jgi:hypothetical protein